LRTVNCNRCNKEVHDTRGLTKYCTECRKVLRCEAQKIRYRRSNILHDKTINCKDCGIEVLNNRNLTKRCKECARKNDNKLILIRYHKNKKLKGRKNPIVYYKLINCVGCGIDVIKNRRGNRKYCSKCAKIKRLEYQRNRRDSIDKTRKCRCGKLFKYSESNKTHCSEKCQKELLYYKAGIKRELLEDQYIINRLKRQGLITPTPEIIEQKRMSLKIKRTIKQIQQAL